jgi:hypothetical protein
MLHNDIGYKKTQEHHAIFGTGNRKLSEKYGLKVYLCLNHHINGKEAVHQNHTNALLIQQAAQITFERRYDHQKWMQTFGKNYLTPQIEKYIALKEHCS